MLELCVIWMLYRAAGAIQLRTAHSHDLNDTATLHRAVSFRNAAAERIVALGGEEASEAIRRGA